MKTRIVRSVTLADTTHFIVQEQVVLLFGLIKYWRDCSSYNPKLYDAVNHHDTLQEAKDWVHRREQWYAALQRCSDIGTVVSTEVVDE